MFCQKLKKDVSLWRLHNVTFWTDQEARQSSVKRQSCENKAQPVEEILPRDFKNRRRGFVVLV